MRQASRRNLNVSTHRKCVILVRNKISKNTRYFVENIFFLKIAYEKKYGK